VLPLADGDRCSLALAASLYESLALRARSRSSRMATRYSGAIYHHQPPPLNYQTPTTNHRFLS